MESGKKDIMGMGHVLLAFYHLLRPYQWYKNLMVLVPLIFVGGLTDVGLLPAVVLSFIALCLVSSSCYCLNDMVDAQSDRLNPEKSQRPIAAGKLSVGVAAFMTVSLGVPGLVLLSIIGMAPFVGGLAIVAITTAYTLWLKNEPLVDVMMLGVNFVLRAAVGAFAISVAISPWLLICGFFLALLLSFGKRHSEMRLLGAGAIRHRSSLRSYTSDNLRLLMSIAATVLLISYALYSFLHNYRMLIFTLPFASYAVMRYLSLALEGDKAARHPHLLLLDGRMLASIVLWGLLTLLVIYLIPASAGNWLTVG
jgi:4-hydroxybenzoate polyprenyltransferase